MLKCAMYHKGARAAPACALIHSDSTPALCTWAVPLDCSVFLAAAGCSRSRQGTSTCCGKPCTTMKKFTSSSRLKAPGLCYFMHSATSFENWQIL